jgi:hypothetical protein
MRILLTGGSLGSHQLLLAFNLGDQQVSVPDFFCHLYWCLGVPIAPNLPM